MPWTHRTFWIAPLLIAAILGALTLLVRSTHLLHIYNARLAESRRERQFLASIGFFTAVLVVRGLTIAIHNNSCSCCSQVMGGCLKSAPVPKVLCNGWDV